MKEKLETYLISITVFEGRHYAIQNMDSYVLIRVFDKKKCTKIRKHTDCPYYNEVLFRIKLSCKLKTFLQYFTFEFKIQLQSLLDNTLTFTVSV